MEKLDQNKTPLFTAIQRHIDAKTIPFHVPGHKQGRGLPELAAYLGEKALQMDLNGMQNLDYINNPQGVIAEAEDLYAQAFGADYAYFLINGTTSGVQAMIMSVCSPGDEIIIPRNAHNSCIGGLILSGAIPVYIQPAINENLGVAMAISTESVEKAIQKHPHAKALFLINPSYYGFTPDIKSIVRLAHQNNMAVLVDEAHGAHMYFHPDFPLPALYAGADMSAASMHKTGGSLTQSSILFLNSKFISPKRVRQVLNLTYTSSASYLLMSSLDIARKQLAIKGKSLLENTLDLARRARSIINKMGDYYAFGPDLVGKPGCYNFDESKLSIHVGRCGYTGYQFETVLRNKYNIQIELADLMNIMAIITIGDNWGNLELLINALQKIKRLGSLKTFRNYPVPPDNEMLVSPRDAFYSPKKTIAIGDAVGEIAGENIMAYPPGIPVVSLGERITPDIVDYIKILKSEDCHLQGGVDPLADYITVLGRESVDETSIDLKKAIPLEETAL